LPAAHPRPGIAQADGAIEHEPTWRRVRIAAEITLPLELDGIVGVCGGKRGFEPAVRQHLEGIGVEIGDEVGGVRVGARKQLVVKPNFRWHRVRDRYPMERGLYLATVRGVAAAGLGIIAAA